MQELVVVEFQANESSYRITQRGKFQHVQVYKQGHWRELPDEVEALVLAARSAGSVVTRKGGEG